MFIVSERQDIKRRCIFVLLNHLFSGTGPVRFLVCRLHSRDVFGRWHRDDLHFVLDRVVLNNRLSLLYNLPSGLHVPNEDCIG